MLQRHNLTPDVLIEQFSDLSLVFLPASDQWVRLNATATELLLDLRREPSVFFTVDDLACLLVARYELGAAYALETAGGLLDAWTRAGIVGPVKEENDRPYQKPSP